MTKKIQFQTEGYSVHIHAKNFVLTDAIQNYVLEKINKVERLSKHVLDVEVTLDVQKLEHSVHILLKFLHFQIQAHASTGDIYSAIDKAMDRLIRLIHKYKDRLQGHHHRGTRLGTIDLNVNVLQPQRDEVKEINAEIEAENWKRDHDAYQMHEVVAKEVLKVRMLTEEEAVMDMELSGKHFMVYKSEEDQKIKVIYRREDGNFGLIAVQDETLS